MMRGPRGASFQVPRASSELVKTLSLLVCPSCTHSLALSAAPWIAFYNREFLNAATVAAIVVLSLPPLSLVTVAHPFISAGQWFPGTRWLGLCLPLVLILTYRRLGTVFTLAVLVGASLSHTHVRFHRPPHDPRIVAVNTRFGGPALRDVFGSHITRPGRGHGAKSPHLPADTHSFP